MTERQIVVIGAGAGGMMAAGRAAEKGASVILLEKMPEVGKKILVSGKGRCNLTNSADLTDFVAAFGSNGRFLYPAFKRFFREELLEFLRAQGVETKMERGGRVFPVSDRAVDVVLALKHYLEQNGARLRLQERATRIQVKKSKVVGVITARGEWRADALILACGGASWPETGSNGDGYALAKESGHTIAKLRPALVPLEVREADLAKQMQGLSLRNVRLSAYRCPADEIKDSSRPFESLTGEMLITHFGLGGPIALLMSKSIVLALEDGPVSVAVDLKPALELKQLNLRLQRDFDRFGKRGLLHLMAELLPQKMIRPLAVLSGIPEEKLGNQISAAERDGLARLLKSLKFNIRGSLPLAAGMVTAGGVSLTEIEPRTLSSKLVEGLYFCGEVMDIDADTGGYNLQAAFSTGRLAGESAADFLAARLS
jgi:predicted Rossmann fold flavoprotein